MPTDEVLRESRNAKAEILALELRATGKRALGPSAAVELYALVENGVVVDILPFMRAMRLKRDGDWRPVEEVREEANPDTHFLDEAFTLEILPDHVVKRHAAVPLSERAKLAMLQADAVRLLRMSAAGENERESVIGAGKVEQIGAVLLAQIFGV